MVSIRAICHVGVFFCIEKPTFSNNCTRTSSFALPFPLATLCMSKAHNCKIQPFAVDPMKAIWSYGKNELNIARRNLLQSHFWKEIDRLVLKKEFWPLRLNVILEEATCRGFSRPDCAYNSRVSSFIKSENLTFHPTAWHPFLFQVPTKWPLCNIFLLSAQKYAS